MPSSTYSRKVAIALAFASALPTPLPLAWVHKFYLGQYLWGIVYLVLSPTLLPQVACCLEGVWYLTQNDQDFVRRFPKAGERAIAASTDLTTSTASTSPIASTNQTTESTRQITSTLRELDQLRQEGLITEYEFEQKRRKLLDQV